MKVCPICQHTYADDSLNFCLDDGSALQSFYDNAPPTVFVDQPRVTDQIHRFEANSPARRTNQQILPNTAFKSPAFPTVQNKTLPTVSLALGIFSLVGGFCCLAGFPLGTAALITGYLGLNNFNRDPLRYGGRTAAIGGMMTGGIGFAISLFLLLISLVKR